MNFLNEIDIPSISKIASKILKIVSKISKIISKIILNFRQISHKYLKNLFFNENDISHLL